QFGKEGAGRREDTARSGPPRPQRRADALAYVHRNAHERDGGLRLLLQDSLDAAGQEDRLYVILYPSG
ncbi:MAG: hypothetical protein KAV87_21270, partial [Desulfobacteraceae bacterium]|nr:hypothetical protein [Desulfobacteraceae bacterium]